MLPHTRTRLSVLVLGSLALPSLGLLALAPAEAGGPPNPETSGAADPLRSRLVEEIPDVETFMQIGAAARPLLTRDGRTLYFTTSMTGTNQLYRLTESGWPYQLTFFPNGIGDYYPSLDEQWIAVTAVPGGTELYQIYLLDARTGAALQITNEPKVRFTAPIVPEGNATMLFSANADDPADFTVYEQDLRTGNRRAVFQRKGLSGITDISKDRRTLLVTHAVASGNNDLYRVDVATGEAVHLTPHEGRVSYTSAAFGEDPDTVYVICDDNPEGFPRLGTIRGTPPAFHPLFPNQEQRWPVEALTISSDYRTLAWVVNEGGYGRLHAWDLRKNRALPFPKLDGIVTQPSLSEVGRIAFTYTSPVLAPDIWIWDASRPEEVKQMTTSTYAGVDPSWFEPPSLIEYESFDGTKIPAFLFLPKKRPKGPIPFIVDVHGGPEAQFRPFFNRHIQYLLLHGYGILAPNVRGSSGYGRIYLDADNYKSRLSSVKDLGWGVKHLIREGVAAPGRIGIKGSSYGGYMTLAAMTEFPDLFAAGLDEVGIANFETFLENTAAYRRDLRASEYGPAEDSEFLRSISPIHKVDQIKGALFVVHGENDPRVPVGEARQILSALVRRGVAVDSLIFPDEGHGVSKLANRLVLYRRMVDFFDRHLKGRSG